MDMHTGHWFILLALLAVPVFFSLIFSRWAMRRALRRSRVAPVETSGRMSVARKFRSGYLPYTAIPVVLLLLLIMFAAGPMALGAAFGLVFLAAGMSLLQLSILLLPAKTDDSARFHTDCAMITLANFLLVPGILTVVVRMLW